MSALEDQLALHIHAVGLPPGEREYRFDARRRWRADFAWPSVRLLVEVEGGTWTKSRHTTPLGFEGDCEKYNTAVLLGYRVLRFTAAMIEDGRAVELIRQALAVDREVA